MIIDAQRLSTEHVLESDICIVGAGPAGITLAKQLASNRIRVLLLESGGVTANQTIQALGAGSSEGTPYVPLEGTRTRQFGGTANQWHIDIGGNRIGVRYMPLDAVDFEKRDWLPHYCGWPFSKAYLDPFYERAQLICRSGTYAYEADQWEREQTSRLPFSEEQLVTKMFQFGPKDVFTHQYREELSASKYVTICLNASVTELETNEDATRVTGVKIKTIEQKERAIKAKLFVLTAGGIENARLLLLSDKVQKNGLGNNNDLVGRFFMDHPLVHGGTLVPYNKDVFKKIAFYDMRWVNDSVVMGKLNLSEIFLRKEKLLNVSTILLPKQPVSFLHPEWTEQENLGIESVKRILKYGVRFKLPPDFQSHSNVLLKKPGSLPKYAYSKAIYTYKRWRNRMRKHSTDIPDLTWGGWSSLPKYQKQFSTIQVVHQTEQIPHPDNRIILSQERDLLGQRKTHLLWKWRPEDIEAIIRTQEIMRDHFAELKIGTFQTNRVDGKPVLLSPSTHHHMGTTRMHEDPNQGVVNANSQVHGIDNLYITGSSIFPTAGYANPTLTIVALSVRLADHIKETLAKEALIIN